MFKVDVIFNSEDISLLNKLYDSLPPLNIKRFYNLFYLTKKDIIQEGMDDNLTSYWKEVRQKLIQYTGMTPYSFYFLEYREGSFCRGHTDNQEEVGLTAVTLINKSEDLEGGESIGYLPHWKSSQDVFDVNRYTQGDDCNNGEQIIPVVMKQQVGETLIYEHNFKHAVSQVQSGTRRVFIAWFKK